MKLVKGLLGLTATGMLLSGCGGGSGTASTASVASARNSMLSVSNSSSSATSSTSSTTSSPATSSPVAGGTTAAGFIPQPGYSWTGNPVDGGTITITSSTGGFVDGSDNPSHTKPFAVAPLLWVPMTTDMNGSPLGRISGPSTWKMVGELKWTPGCGPPGTAGCASGANWPGDGATGGPGVMSNYTAGFDLSEWSGWSSQNGGYGYYWNDLGQQFYLWRQEDHVGFGHLDNVAANSYNGIGHYNVKILRLFSVDPVTHAEVSPDIFYPSDNQLFTVASCGDSSNNCSDLGISSGAPRQYINATTPGGPDVNGSLSAQQAFDGMKSGTGAYNNWATTEMMLQSNSDASAASYPPTSQFSYTVVGYNNDQPLETWPVRNYQNETTGVNWMFVDSSSLQASNGLGTVIRAYPLHYVVDGTSGCPECSDLPKGAYVNFGPVYVDDSWCHAVVQDSPIYDAATKREIQIPVSIWNDTEVELDLRKGEFSSLSGEYLFIINEKGTAHLIGRFS